MDNDPYAEGNEAYHAGQSEAENPYDPESQEGDFMSWNDGFNNAAEIDLEELES